MQWTAGNSRTFPPEVREWLRGQLGEVFHGHNARLGLGRFNYIGCVVVYGVSAARPPVIDPPSHGGGDLFKS